MRLFVLAAFASLIGMNGLQAQEAKAQPRTEPPPPASAMSEKNQKYLDAYLKAWEDRMSKITTLETKIVLTEIGKPDPAGKSPAEISGKYVYTGDASIMKPNFAKMLLKHQDQPANEKKWRHFVADGDHLWDYQYSNKIARVLQLPKNGVADNIAINFLFGMKADEIKKRFEISMDVDDKDKFNDHYMHIQILPKSRADQQEFKKAELVLWKNNKDEKFADRWMLPARFWMQSVEGNQVVWEFQNLNTKKELKKMDFKAPGFPDKEWKSEWMAPPTPTVSRTLPPAK